MITFKHFLEDFDIPDNENLKLKKIYNYIRENCKDYLSNQDSNVVPIYRGITNTSIKKDEILTGSNRVDDLFSFIMQVRKDRKPRDSNEWLHASLDKFFENTFNVKARSAGVFASTDLDMVKGYGGTYVIYPVGEYFIIYSKDISDAYDALNDGIYSLGVNKPLSASKIIRDKALATLSDYAHAKDFKLAANAIDHTIATNEKNVSFETAAQEMSLTKAEYDNVVLEFIRMDAAKGELMDLFLKNYGRDLYKEVKSLSEDEKNEAMIVCDKYVAVNIRTNNQLVALL